MLTIGREAQTSPSIYFRMRWWVFAFFTLLTPLVAYAAHRAVQSNSNNVADWLPESFEETLNLYWFNEHFGTDSFLMIAWQGGVVGDPRIALLANDLRQPADLGRVSEVKLFDQVMTTDEVLQQLQQPPLELPLASAKRRLAGWLLGADGATSCIVAVVSEEGFEQRHQLAEYIQQRALQHPGFSDTPLHIAGSVLDSVAIDRASSEHLVSLSIASFAICFLLMLCLLRSFLMSSMLLINALFCQQLALAVVYVSGTQMDSILLMVPMLIFVLSISTGVHLINYYRDAVRDGGLAGAPMRAVRHGLAPCWLSSATTALGMASLLLSQLSPVQKFGWFSAVMVLTATVVLFVLLPSQLEQLPKWQKPRRQGKDLEQWSTPFQGWQRLVYLGRYWILLGGVLLTGWGAVGVSQLQTGVRLHDMFPANAKIIRDYDWLEEHIGPLVPFEIVLQLPKALDPEAGAEGPNMLQRLQLLGAAHRAVAQTEGVGAVVSALNFGPPLGGLDRGGMRGVVHRAVINKKLEAAREDYIQAGLLRESTETELWRLSARAYAGQEIDYGQLLGAVRKHLEPVLSDAYEQGFRGMSLTFAGGVPLVQKAQQQMLQDLVNSFTAAFVCIACVMALLMVGMSWRELRAARGTGRLMVALRAVAAGWLAMIPNVLPCLVVLGSMGWLGVRMEIGAMMTASVALGIAVDDTLHFLTWFRRGSRLTATRYEAVAMAYDKCGVAMMQTSLICGLGLLAYALSSFIPVVRFAWVMVAMLSSALLADLLLLPALLLSPLGALFQPATRHEHSD